MKEKTPCAACGPVPGSHLSLWITNSISTLFPSTSTKNSNTLVRLYTKAAERFMDVLCRLFFTIGRMTGDIRLGDDTALAISDRSRLLWEEAKRRGIPMRQLIVFNRPIDVFDIEMNGRKYFFQSIPFPPHIYQDALDMDDKVAFKKRLREAGLPVPKSYSVHTLKNAKEVLRELGTVCVKPQSGSNGRHTYPYVKTEEDLSFALASAKQLCAFTSIEEHIEGNLCRATCVDGKLVGFLESYYPSITGDGVHTISELVALKNKNKEKGVNDIVLSDSHEGYIRRRGYAFDTVLENGVSLSLTYRGGYGQGGGNREHGRAIHPSFIPLIEEAARLTDLAIVGFDIIIPDPLRPQDTQRWGFIEANSLPWIDLHNAPLYGTPIDLSPYVWDLWNAGEKK